MALDPGPETTYDIAVDVAALRWESATPNFARYSVSLTGKAQEAWLECFESASSDSAEFSRFHLDPETMTVSFNSRMSDGPAEVASVLLRLQLLVAFVNARARRPDSKEPMAESTGKRVARGGSAR